MPRGNFKRRRQSQLLQGLHSKCPSKNSQVHLLDSVEALDSIVQLDKNDANCSFHCVFRQGYNTIQMMAVMEHAYYGCFGYQVIMII